jgi:hypothetical protein
MNTLTQKFKRKTRRLFDRLRSAGQGFSAYASSPPPPYWSKEEYHGNPVDKNKLRMLHNKHAGERCFIVGNGPSLNEMDLLKMQNDVSIAVNGIFYKTDETGYCPTYYVVEDRCVMADNRARINSYEAGLKLFPSYYYDQVTQRKNTAFFQMNRGFYEKTSPNFEIPRFSTDFSERAYCGQSVTYINLQLAYYLGFSEVYLIGIDFSYEIPESAIINGHVIESTEDDPNHFHPDYFGKGKKWNDPKLHNVLKNLELAKMVFEWSGRRVFNATKGGKLEVFERRDYDALF